jgi:uncharacterized protein YecE (DUF72 family)
MKKSQSSGTIRAGIGGWTYDPWRETFYPANVPKKNELHYASRQVTAIEINGTFYRLQTPAVFAKWRDETPDDFMFSIKAPRYLTHRKVLAEAKDSIPRFIASGLGELKQKLGPILWQLPPTMPFNAVDLGAFLESLPTTIDTLPLRHVLEVRHETFMSAEYVDLARKHGVTTVYADTEEYPTFADVTGPFVYARLRRAQASEATGYPKPDLDAWMKRVQTWASGSAPDDLHYIASATSTPKSAARDVFVFFINGAKERAPAAAKHFLSLIR